MNDTLVNEYYWRNTPGELREFVKRKDPNDYGVTEAYAAWEMYEKRGLADYADWDDDAWN